MNPLDFDAEGYLRHLNAAAPLAAVGKSLAAQTPDSIDFSNISNFSRERELPSIEDYKNELKRLQELYDLCINFESKPFPRKLDSKCRAAGYEALNRIHSQISVLRKQFQTVKQPESD